MRAVILTAPGLEHAYVTNVLASELGESLVAVVLEHQSQSLERVIARYSPPRILERVITKTVRTLLRHQQRQAAALRAALGDCRLSVPAEKVIDAPASLNDPRTIEAVKRLMPTHLFVYGTGIVGATMRSVAPLALNMHTGISPYYRGADTEFWPLYHGQPEMVGATVHVCSALVDGGDIFGTVRAPVAPTDSPFDAFAASVKVGAMLYADVAGRLRAGVPLTPAPQDFTLGRAYRFIDRTFVHDIRMELRHSLISLRRALAD